MKKIILFILFFAMVATLVSARAGRDITPLVRYISPKNDAMVDLKNKETLTFKWKSTPKPGGRREAYKFELFKEFGYERIVEETLSHNLYSIQIPTDKFEDDTTYTWQVKQRDGNTHTWSGDNRWSFKIKK